MPDPLRSLLTRARGEASRERIQHATVAGCAIAAAGVIGLSAFVRLPWPLLALLAIPAAALASLTRRRSTDVTLARSLDERFATGDLLATALHVDERDAIGRAIATQATSVAARLAMADLAVDRVAMRRRLAAGGIAVAASLLLSAVIAPAGRVTGAARPTIAIAGEGSSDRVDSATDRPTSASETRRAGDVDSADASRMTAADHAAVHDAGRTAADGTGAAMTAATIAPPPPRDGDASQSIGEPAAGDGSARERSMRGATAGGGVAARAAIAVEPSTSLAGQSTIASDAIDVGRVPAASRAIVRAFFDSGDATR